MLGRLTSVAPNRSQSFPIGKVASSSLHRTTSTSATGSFISTRSPPLPIPPHSCMKVFFPIPHTCRRHKPLVAQRVCRVLAKTLFPTSQATYDPALGSTPIAAYAGQILVASLPIPALLQVTCTPPLSPTSALEICPLTACSLEDGAESYSLALPSHFPTMFNTTPSPNPDSCDQGLLQEVRVFDDDNPQPVTPPSH